MAKIENAHWYAFVVYPRFLFSEGKKEIFLPLKVCRERIFSVPFFDFFPFRSDKIVIIHFPSVSGARKQQHSFFISLATFIDLLAHEKSIYTVKKHGRRNFALRRDRESGKVNNKTTRNVFELCTFGRNVSRCKKVFLFKVINLATVPV